jgi:hypothetical protein
MKGPHLARSCRSLYADLCMRIFVCGFLLLIHGCRFITVSNANWTDQMNHFWSATSSLVNIYFVTLILFGSYFALNLVLVRTL